MKKWENPELMTLGVENTKEEIDTMDKKWWKCPVCGERHKPGHGCGPVAS